MENIMRLYKQKTTNLKNLSDEEQSKLLALTAEQRESIANRDRIAKTEYLKSA